MFGDTVLGGGPIEAHARGHGSSISPHHGRSKQPTRTSERRRQQVRENSAWGRGLLQQQRFGDNVDDRVSDSLTNVERTPVSNSGSGLSGHTVTWSVCTTSGLVTSGSVVDIAASKSHHDTVEKSPGSLRRAAVKVDRLDRSERQGTAFTTTQLEGKVTPFSVKPVVAITSLIFDNCRSTTRDVGQHSLSQPHANACRPKKLTSHQSPNIMAELTATQKSTPRRRSIDVINDYPAMTSSLKHNHASGYASKNHRSLSLSSEATLADPRNVLHPPGTWYSVQVMASGHDRTQLQLDDKALLRQHYHSATAVTDNRHIGISELHPAYTDSHTPSVDSGTGHTSGDGQSAVSPSDIMRMAVSAADRTDPNERVGAGLSDRSHMAVVAAHRRLLRQFQTTASSTTAHGSRKMASLNPSASTDLSSSSSVSLNETAKHVASGLSMRYTRQPSDHALMLVPTSGLHVSDDVTRISSGKIVDFDSMLERRLYYIDNVPGGPPPSPVQ